MYHFKLFCIIPKFAEAYTPNTIQQKKNDHESYTFSNNLFLSFIILVFLQYLQTSTKIQHENFDKLSIGFSLEFFNLLCSVLSILWRLFNKKTWQLYDISLLERHCQYYTCLLSSSDWRPQNPSCTYHEILWYIQTKSGMKSTHWIRTANASYL